MSFHISFGVYEVVVVVQTDFFGKKVRCPENKWFPPHGAEIPVEDGSLSCRVRVKR